MLFRKQRILWFGMKHAALAAQYVDTDRARAEAHEHIARLAVAAMKYLDAGKREEFLDVLNFSRRDQEDILATLQIGKHNK